MTQKLFWDMQAGEKEVSAPFPSVLLHLPVQHSPWLQENPTGNTILLGMHQGKLLPLASGTEANPMLFLSFLPQATS